MQIPNKAKKAVIHIAVVLDHHVRRNYGKGIVWKPAKPMAIPAKDAVGGGGPEFQRFSRFPCPMVNALDVWAVRKLSPARRSTSDKGER
jgi:hypothetical protein